MKNICYVCQERINEEDECICDLCEAPCHSECGKTEHNTNESNSSQDAETFVCNDCLDAEDETGFEEKYWEEQ